MTVNGWRVCGPSYQRHGEIGLGMRYSRPDDGDDANDGNIRAYARQWTRLYFVGPYPLHPDPTNPTHRARSPVPMRSWRPLAASGLSNLAGNQTPLPDEKDGPSSGLSRASSGQQPEPDDNKPLTSAGYSDYRRVCRVLGEGMREDTRGQWEEGVEEMLLEGLKAESKVRTGRAVGPLDVPEG